MQQTKTIKISTGEVMVVDLPIGATNVRILGYSETNESLSYRLGTLGSEHILIPLRYISLGPLSEITDEDAKRIMPGISTGQLDGVWYSADGNNYNHSTALLALNSLMEANGVVTVNKYDPLDFKSEVECYSELHKNWQSEQSKLWTNPLILFLKNK